MTKIQTLSEIAETWHQTTKWTNLSVDSRRNCIEIQRNQIMERGLEIQENLVNAISRKDE